MLRLTMLQEKVARHERKSRFDRCWSEVVDQLGCLIDRTGCDASKTEFSKLDPSPVAPNARCGLAILACTEDGVCRDAMYELASDICDDHLLSGEESSELLFKIRPWCVLIEELEVCHVA